MENTFTALRDLIKELKKMNKTLEEINESLKPVHYPVAGEISLDVLIDGKPLNVNKSTGTVHLNEERIDSVSHRNFYR